MAIEFWEKFWNNAFVVLSSISVFLSSAKEKSRKNLVIHKILIFK